VKVNTTWFVLLLGLGVGCWVFWVATEVRLRRKDKQSKSALPSSMAGPADCPDRSGGGRFAFGDGTGLWVFTGLILPSYLVVGTLLVQRLKGSVERPGDDLVRGEGRPAGSGLSRNRAAPAAGLGSLASADHAYPEAAANVRLGRSVTCASLSFLNFATSP